MPFVKIKPDPSPVMWYRNKVGRVYFAKLYPHLNEYVCINGTILSIDCYTVKPNLFQIILLAIGFNINVK